MRPNCRSGWKVGTNLGAQGEDAGADEGQAAVFADALPDHLAVAISASAVDERVALRRTLKGGAG